ncbi:hypothetical protein AVO42_09340 [Thiomicrospira sp. XS5]|uniref:hypothetical protein n=1 Tax=Thiomicrospira sp. XS5 TaxID=1775636 RepID=UPI0007473679|nr:hypothetical protein [Thiomicrospira sp. XS5]KUJ75512.1 hypothetical protein AVO42_09340 [Thiomicrospira sp. XS5]
MNRTAILASAVVMFLTFQSIAEAASISTRVRILESKVYKQGKLIKQQAKKDHAYTSDLKQGLKEIELLRIELQKFMREKETSKKKPSYDGDLDRAYSFP